jgi:hypothetical protein
LGIFWTAWSGVVWGAVDGFDIDDDVVGVDDMKDIP